MAHFGAKMRVGKVPGKREIDDYIKKTKSQRDWKKIKYYVRFMMKKGI